MAKNAIGGRVLVWDPTNRIVLSWEIGADWKYDPSFSTEIEVEFLAEGPEKTRDSRISQSGAVWLSGR